MHRIEIRHGEPEDAIVIQQLYTHQTYIFVLVSSLIHQSLCGKKKRLIEFSEQNIPHLLFLLTVKSQVILALIIDNHPRRRHIVSFGIGVGAEFSGKV